MEHRLPPFDPSDPFHLPRLNDDLEPLDLALVYFTISSKPPWKGGEQRQPGWSSSKVKLETTREPEGVQLNLFGAVRLASYVEPPE